MSKLCERPGCSEPGAAQYGMVPEDLLFWIIATDADTPPDAKLLCRRHADAMVVPRGWTLDDRRQPVPSLFQTRRYTTSAAAMRAADRLTSPRRHVRQMAGQAVEQLQIDGTGPIPRPSAETLAAIDAEPVSDALLDAAFDRGVDTGDTAVEAVDIDADIDIDTGLGAPDTAPIRDQPDAAIDDAPAGSPEDGTNFNAWRPDFDTDDDLGGLLQTKSPLLSRAFRGTARQR